MFVKQYKKLFLLVTFALFLVSCGGSSGGGTEGNSSSTIPSDSSGSSSSNNTPEESGSSATAIIKIDPMVRHQSIDGFGGALPMWTHSFLSPDEVHKLVGLGQGQLGLSVLRTIVRPKPVDWPRAVNNLITAQKYVPDTKILATPWTPPLEYKTHNEDRGETEEGTKVKLKTEHYSDFADHLNNYLLYMKEQGVRIDVMSIQNEPDWLTTNEACFWEGEDILNFIRDYGDKIQTKVMIGDSFQFDWDVTDPSLSDSTALQNFEYIGGHIYNRSVWNRYFKQYPLAQQNNKGIWMTEWNIHEADDDRIPTAEAGEVQQTTAAVWGGDDLNVWNESLDTVMASVHRAMVSDWNAYIWWWARRYYSFIGDGVATERETNGTIRGEVLKRGYAFSHYSKYVRPGFVRIDAETELPELDVTAYQGDEKIVLVFLNRSENDYQNVEIDISESFVDLRAFVTSQFKNRENLTIQDSDGTPVLPIVPARSIVTVELFSSLPPIPWRPPENDFLIVELEKLVNQKNFSPLVVESSAVASGGEYIVWPNGQQLDSNISPSPDLSRGGYVEIDFNLSEDTDVSFKMLADFISANDDSFHYWLDGEYVSFVNSRQASWNLITFYEVSLMAGKHTLVIQHREDGARMDRIDIVPKNGEASLINNE